MRRIRLKLAYDGTEFHGWQVQPGLPTVQGTLEEVLEMINKHPVAVHGSGRTDACVHAEAQVAAFFTANPIPCENLRKAMNTLLPHAIRVLTVEEVAAEFHPRFHARGKHYEYRMWREEICPPFLRRYVHHHPYRLDEAAMVEAARVYEGRHDFTNFAAKDESRDRKGLSKVRTVFSSRLQREGALLVYRVHGSGFLKHMVRNMVGGLVEVGRGNLTAGQLAAFLEAPFAAKAGATVPGSGLFLMRVEYDEAGQRDGESSTLTECEADE